MDKLGELLRSYANTQYLKHNTTSSYLNELYHKELQELRALIITEVLTNHA